MLEKDRQKRSFPLKDQQKKEQNSYFLRYRSEKILMRDPLSFLLLGKV